MQCHSACVYVLHLHSLWSLYVGEGKGGGGGGTVLTAEQEAFCWHSWKKLTFLVITGLLGLMNQSMCDADYRCNPTYKNRLFPAGVDRPSPKEM